MAPHAPDESDASSVSARLHACVRLLAGGATALPEERIQAVRTLATAPAHPSWERGLLQGLVDPDEPVRRACRQACVERLALLEARPEQQDAFLNLLLSACFTPHRAALSESYAALLHVVADALLARPLRYEHHRSRLLLHAASSQLGRVHPPFALALSQVLQRFAEESSRSDTAEVRALLERQRLRTYQQPGAPAAVLLLYLRADRHLALAQIQPELLLAYAALLAHGSAAPQVITELCANLCVWLAERPSPAMTSPALVIEAARAASGRPWSLLPVPLRLQLEVAAALCPGQPTPGDLLTLLCERYAFCDDETVALRALAALACLPVLRMRIPELCAALREPLLQQRSPAFWAAALDVIGTLLTGLDEQPATAGIEPRFRRLMYVHRPGWRIGAHDLALRDLLRQLSTGPALPSDLRLRAWRMLLACIPHDLAERRQLYAQGCARHDEERLAVSLELAAQTCQRFVWWQVQGIWSGLTVGDAQTPGRRQRLTLVCQLFAALRQPAAVERHDERCPPMLGLALDDPDPLVRTAARQALQAAELTAALEAEEQLRALGAQERSLVQLDDQRRALEQTRDSNYRVLLQAQQRTQDLERQRQHLEREQQRIEEELTREVRWREETLHKLEAVQREAQQKLHVQRIQLETLLAQVNSLTERIDLEEDRLREIRILKDLQDRQRVELERDQKELEALHANQTQRLRSAPDEATVQELLAAREQTRQDLTECAAEIQTRREQVEAKVRLLRVVSAQVDVLQEERNGLLRQHQVLKQALRQSAGQLATCQQQQREAQAQLDEAYAHKRSQLAAHQQRVLACEEQWRQASGALDHAEREQARLVADLGRNEHERSRSSAEAQLARERVQVLLKRASAAIDAADQAADALQQQIEQKTWTQQELFALCMGCLESALRRNM